jgi:hypothetical protein
MIPNSMISLLLIVALPASFSDVADWRQTKGRVLLDQALEKVSEQCGQVGFDRVEPASDISMEKRIHGHLLLQSNLEADMLSQRWYQHFLVMDELLNPARLDAAAASAGNAITAATLDPAFYEKGREKYAKAMVDHMTPFLEMCTQAAADQFLAENYLTGTGSLKAIEQNARQGFDAVVKSVQTEQ